VNENENKKILETRQMIIDRMCFFQRANNLQTVKAMPRLRKMLAMCTTPEGREFEQSGQIVRIESEEFGTIYLGPMELRESPDPPGIVYRAYEIEDMMGLEGDTVRAIHRLKATFGGFLCWVEPPPQN
jgi:hypothetical protein